MIPLRHNQFGSEYMPLNLKGVLARHNITQAAWCGQVKQFNGAPLSQTAGDQILNWDTWPKQTPKSSIRKQTEALLAEKRVSKIEIDTCWWLDENDDFRNAKAQGERQPKNAVDLKPLENEMLSHEAKNLFDLPRDPFNGDPASDKEFFMSPDIRRVMASVSYTALHDSILAVIGESGSGKTVLFHFAREKLLRDAPNVRMIIPAVINKKELTERQIMESIILDLAPHTNVPRTKEARARKARQLLIDSADAGNKHMLMIEEAHDLPVSTMKELKRIFEIAGGLRRVISMLLIGQPELKEKLNERTSFDAREFIRRCEIDILHPLDKHLEDYISLRLGKMDKKLDAVFEKDACDAIRERLTGTDRSQKKVSQVYPLLVNRLVTKAMNAAAELGLKKIPASIVREL
jgi:type II secretory pathway predicted ATPase ExeA